MKTLTLTFFLILSQITLADGIDRIHVHLNGELIYTTVSNETLAKYEVQEGDTLMFDAWTDWNILDKATLTLRKLNSGQQLLLSQERNRKYGAQFIYIVTKEDIYDGFDVILNYNIPDFKPEHFLSFQNGNFK